MPSWLTTLLLVVGLLIGAAFLAELVLAVRRRRAATRAARPAGSGADVATASQTTPVTGALTEVNGPPTELNGAPTPLALASPGRMADSEPGRGEARIVVADHDQVMVTPTTRDGTVYVLRPPGTDPAEILRAARLVLPEGPYRQLAEQLGLPGSWPIMVADYDRVVVTCTRDGTVYVLRPPGEDPRAILRAARLVLPECSYGELADHLGVPAIWPVEYQPGAAASSVE
jgi:hypothetical protein